MQSLIAILGYAALLLWGTRMVTSGMSRGFGALLRTGLAHAVASPARAFFAGLGITLLLQSSTATGLMAAAFAAEGMVGLSSGFMVMLGANVGTAAVARLLSFPVAALAPAAIAIGVLVHRRSGSNRGRSLARIAIGLGLMLLALSLLVTQLSSAGTDPLAHAVEQWVFRQPWLTLVFAALAAWLCHSSMAVVLLAGAMAYAQGLDVGVAIALMLGANLGGALAPLLEVSGNLARRLPLGNLLVRAIGCVALMTSADLWTPAVPAAWSSSPVFVVDAHLVFNIVLAAIFAPLAPIAGRLLKRLLPDPPLPDDPGQPRYLDKDAAEHGHLALAQAEREVVRMAEMVEGMLAPALAVLRSGNPDPSLAATERSMERLGLAIRSYLASLSAETLSGEETDRRQGIGQFVVDLGSVADILANAVAAPSRLAHVQASMTQAEAALLDTLAADVRQAFKLALAVFFANDRKAARVMVQSKPALRDIEARALALCQHTPGLSRSGDALLRAVRDLKRVHSQLAGVAYRTLEGAGELRPRLLEATAPPLDQL